MKKVLPSGIFFGKIASDTRLAETVILCRMTYRECIIERIADRLGSI